MGFRGGNHRQGFMQCVDRGMLGACRGQLGRTGLLLRDTVHGQRACQCMHLRAGKSPPDLRLTCRPPGTPPGWGSPPRRTRSRAPPPPRPWLPPRHCQTCAATHPRCREGGRPGTYGHIRAWSQRSSADVDGRAQRSHSSEQGAWRRLAVRCYSQQTAKDSGKRGTAHKPTAQMWLQPAVEVLAVKGLGCCSEDGHLAGTRCKRVLKALHSSGGRQALGEGRDPRPDAGT